MGLREWFAGWPVYRQLTGGDPLGRGAASASARSAALTPRTETADRVVKSVCPYCAVGCGQDVYVAGGKVTQIEGDADSPISRGRLCPKGAASEQLVNSPTRVTKVRYRRPYGTQWEDLDLDTAVDMIADRVIETRRRTWQDTDQDGRVLNRTMGIAHLGGATLDTAVDMIADRVIETRRRTWQDTDQDGRVLNRTMGIAHLGGATLDNEENYLMKKLYTALGAVQVENQARI